MQLGELRDLLAAVARANHVPGVQLALFRDGEIRALSFGKAEHGGGVALTNDAKVPIGSITKTFTAILAMVLVSDGDLELDEPVAEYLPELRRAETATGLTTRHLLSHTGGLAAECAGAPIGRAGWSRWLHGIQSPGVGFSYSNLGYALAGRLIEAVTGVSWTAAMQDILLKPLGITPEFVTENARSAHVTGHAVNRRTRRVRPVAQALEPVEAPAGGLALSATDLVTLGRALLSSEVADGLVAPAELAELRQPVPRAEPFGLADGWGLGLALFQGGWLGHDGTADGTVCHLRVDPATETVVALTTNASTGGEVWQQLVDELDIGDYAAPTHTKHRASPPRGCGGSYHNGDIEYAVLVRGNDVELVVDGEPAARMVTHDDLTFSIIELNTGEKGRPGRFLRDSRGYIDRVQIGGRVALRRQRAREVA